MKSPTPSPTPFLPSRTDWNQSSVQLKIISTHTEKLVCTSLYLWKAFPKGFIIITIIQPLTVRVVGVPQMISQPVSSIFSPLFSTVLWDLANSMPVQSLMLSSHLFFWLPCLLPPFTVLARPDEREICPYYCCLRLFTMVSRSSCGHGMDFLVGDVVFVKNA